MLTIILGGSASGKSEFAETLAVQEQIESSGRRLYVATMQAFDEESQKRIQKHREQRQGKGFVTVEQYRDVEKIEAQKEDIVLLECMSNLLANEMYAGSNMVTEVVAKVIHSIRRLEEKCGHLIIVSNDVFHDGCAYSEETMQYLDYLGRINRELSRRANRVVEVVCGIPIEIERG